MLSIAEAFSSDERIHGDDSYFMFCEALAACGKTLEASISARKLLESLQGSGAFAAYKDYFYARTAYIFVQIGMEGEAYTLLGNIMNQRTIDTLSSANTIIEMARCATLTGDKSLALRIANMSEVVRDQSKRAHIIPAVATLLMDMDEKDQAVGLLSSVDLRDLTSDRFDSAIVNSHQLRCDALAAATKLLIQIGDHQRVDLLIQNARSVKAPNERNEFLSAISLGLSLSEQKDLAKEIVNEVIDTFKMPKFRRYETQLERYGLEFFRWLMAGLMVFVIISFFIYVRVTGFPKGWWGWLILLVVAGYILIFTWTAFMYVWGDLRNKRHVNQHLQSLLETGSFEDILESAEKLEGESRNYALSKVVKMLARRKVSLDSLCHLICRSFGIARNRGLSDVYLHLSVFRPLLRKVNKRLPSLCENELQSIGQGFQN
jgi:hypothetical protein